MQKQYLVNDIAGEDGNVVNQILFYAAGRTTFDENGARGRPLWAPNAE